MNLNGKTLYMEGAVRELAVKRFGGIDILVNNASAIGLPPGTEDLSPPISSSTEQRPCRFRKEKGSGRTRVGS